MTPVALTAQVLAVDVEAAKQTTTATDPVGALRREVDAALPGLLRRFAVRATLIALAGGAIGALLLPGRSEEHTSELQSLMRISYAVFCLKKKKKTLTPILLIT